MDGKPQKTPVKTGKRALRAAGLGLLVVLCGVFSHAFFPWPLWPLFWVALSATGCAMLVSGPPARQGRDRQPPAGAAGFEAFDDRIKWDKFK